MGCHESIYASDHSPVDSLDSQKKSGCMHRGSKSCRRSVNCFRTTNSVEKLSPEEQKLSDGQIMKKRPPNHKDNGHMLCHSGDSIIGSKPDESAAASSFSNSEKKDLRTLKPSHSYPWSSLNEAFLREIIRLFPFHSSTIDTHAVNATSASAQKAKRHNSNCNIKNRKSFALHSPERNLSPVKRSSSFATLEEKKTPNFRHSKKASALNLMVLKSVETIVPMVVPLEVWLRHRLSNWVQLSGHKGAIIPASQKTLWKKQQCKEESYEAEAYRDLKFDACAPFIPKFYKQVEYNGEIFMEIEDLTSKFKNPAIMDIKVGTRTFMESEVDNPRKRPDLYLKMVQLDPTEPSLEENAEKAITKLRYMQFRERESSTAELGFRIDAIKERNSPLLRKDFKKLKEQIEIRKVFVDFFDATHCKSRLSRIHKRLKELRSAIEQSKFFRTHEVIGSSLLFIYDDHTVNVWMIDFAKSILVQGPNIVDHRAAWCLGNHADGYLTGIDNLIQIIETCC